MKRFYYVADWGSKNYLFAENILCSAGSSWSNNKFRTSQFIFAPTIKRLFIDSGGFAVHKRFGEYPYTVEQYIEYVQYMMEKWPVTEVAILDYPCEPTVNREIYSSNLDRIRITVDNAISCIDADHNIPWVPVIQGYSLKEYLTCWGLYQDAGIKANLWAMGSVCARKKLGGIRTIVTALHKRTKQNLHAFGLTLVSIRDPQVFFALESSDSLAWNWYAKNKEAKIQGYLNYEKKIRKVFDGFSHQTKLTEHVR